MNFPPIILNTFNMGDTLRRTRHGIVGEVIEFGADAFIIGQAVLIFRHSSPLLGASEFALGLLFLMWDISAYVEPKSEVK